MNRIGLLFICVLLGGSAHAAAPTGDIPSPPRRPIDLPTQQTVTTPEIPVPPVRPPDLGEQPAPQGPPAVAVSNPVGEECASAKAGGPVIGQIKPQISGPGACGIASPIEVSAILLPNGDKVAIRPPALIGCPMASALADWVREDLAPAVSTSGERLSVIEEAGSYSCRGRDGIAGAILSEHGKGDAIDITALRSQSGSFFTVAQHPNTVLAHAFRDSACRRFSTVLGPGADSYHTSHIHLDLEPRRNHGHFCQWDLP